VRLWAGDPSSQLRIKCSDHNGRNTHGHGIVWDIMSDYCVRPDHAIPPNPSAKNADILADPRTVSDRDPFFESNRLMQDRAGNVLILMKVV
jgi:hypothetical protein